MALRVGDVEIVPLSDGEGVFPVGFDEVFPDVAASELEPWQAVYPATFASPTVPPARYGAFLLRSPGATILVDTGFGMETGPFPPGGGLLADLASHGVMPADIDLVVFSHLHPDHVGQTFGPDGEPVFEHAAYAVAEADWRHFTDPARAGELPWISPQPGRLASRRADGGAFELRLLFPGGAAAAGTGAEEAIAPGVTALLAPGHTPGHTALVVRSGGSEALLAADAFFHPAQLAHPEWRNAADHDPTRAEATRRALLARILDRDVVLGACHFPAPALGHLRTVDGHPRWVPLA
jgi:glyoxylase-like metal-dependent hydrolase (beta-lactamase superfamily II)